ncbi:MAG: hypothetical protein ABI233_04420 [Chthoniobacterales bacterium]
MTSGVEAVRYLPSIKWGMTTSGDNIVKSILRDMPHGIQDQYAGLNARWRA